MARTAKKTKPSLTFDQPTSIPLNDLTLHPDNVRGVDVDKKGIESLAADIALRGLLQSLTVQPMKENPAYFGVIDGGRRYRALQLLVKQGRLAKDAPIPCILREGGVVIADSLAANMEREDLHPIDQFHAFKALSEQGKGEHEIAAAFRVTPTVVKQRLRLANASPKLLKAYREEKIDLDQLMAFCLTDNHARHEQVLEAVLKQSWNNGAASIRRMIAEDTVASDDKRALFVGLDAYKDAGGEMLLDLFSEEGGGFLQSPEILDRLVEEKLSAAADEVRAEGWYWVEHAIDIPWERRRNFVEIDPAEPALTDEEEEELEKLYENYEAEEGVANPRIEELEAKIPVYSDEQKANAAAFVSLDHNGKLLIERGFVPREENPRQNDKEGSGAAKTKNGGAGASKEKGLSEALTTELTAYHTLGLRNALAENYTFAFSAVLHAMVLDLFYGGYQVAKSCLQIKSSDSGVTAFEGLDSFQANKEIKARHKAFQGELPGDAGELWEYIIGMTKGAQEELFAHCAGLTVNAVHQKFEGPDKRDHACLLAKEIHLDMSDQGFTVSAENFFGRVSKEIIKESIGAEEYGKISSMKKAEMAKAAAKVAAKKNWLPEPLRTPRDGDA